MNFSLTKLTNYLNSIIILYVHFFVNFIELKTVQLNTMTPALFPIYL